MKCVLQPQDARQALTEKACVPPSKYLVSPHAQCHIPMPEKPQLHYRLLLFLLLLPMKGCAHNDNYNSSVLIAIVNVGQAVLVNKVYNGA